MSCITLLRLERTKSVWKSWPSTSASASIAGVHGLALALDCWRNSAQSRGPDALAELRGDTLLDQRQRVVDLEASCMLGRATKAPRLRSI